MKINQFNLQGIKKLDFKVIEKYKKIFIRNVSLFSNKQRCDVRHISSEGEMLVHLIKKG